MPEMSVGASQVGQNTLAGKVVLLAGGTGGLGSATALLLAQEGARLVLGYRGNRARAQQVRDRLCQLGAAVELVEGDLGEPGAPEEYVRKATAFGPLTGVAIFAGDPARGPAASPGEAEIERWQASWQTNFLGPYRLAQCSAQEMAAQKTAGSIVLVATMQAVAPFAQSAAYAAPKAALVHAARVLALEYGGTTNLCVNVVAPGVTTAGMAQASVASGKYERFLLEPDSYLTGQVITVDGGLTLRR